MNYVNANTNTITAVTGYADQIASGDLDFEMDDSLLVGEGDIGNLEVKWLRERNRRHERDEESNCVNIRKSSSDRRRECSSY